VMAWIDDYRAKLCSAAEAVKSIRSGNRVYYSGNASVPRALVTALAARRDELADVQLVHVLLLGHDPLGGPEMAGHFRHNSLFVGPADREAVNEGRADYVPVFLHQIPRLFDEHHVPLDVAMLQVSKPDEHGFMSFGLEVMQARSACRAARSVIVQGDHEYGKIALASALNYEIPSLVPDAVPPNIGYLAQSFQVNDLDETARACAAVQAEVFSGPVELALPGRGNCQSLVVRNPGSGALQELFQVL